MGILDRVLRLLVVPAFAVGAFALMRALAAVPHRPDDTLGGISDVFLGVALICTGVLVLVLAGVGAMQAPRGLAVAAAATGAAGLATAAVLAVAWLDVDPGRALLGAAIAAAPLPLVALAGPGRSTGAARGATAPTA